MPTLKEIANRIKAVSAIKKTTEAMKMIAQARVAKAEARLKEARLYSENMESAFKAVTAAGRAGEAPTVQNTQWVAFGTDQGLCGSINSGMGRHVFAKIDAAPKDSDVKIFPFGNRLISGTVAKFESKIDGAVCNYQKNLTYKQSLAMCDLLLKDPLPTTRIIAFNRMINMAAYTIDEINIPDRSCLDQGEVGTYETEGGNEIMSDFYDFYFATMMWRVLSEVETSELSSRSMAMTNSTKAASDMETNLKLIYNKLRQDVITTEIIEISTGATQTLKNKKTQ